jgi:hypothetical protein
MSSKRKWTWREWRDLFLLAVFLLFMMGVFYSSFLPDPD